MKSVLVFVIFFNTFLFANVINTSQANINSQLLNIVLKAEKDININTTDDLKKLKIEILKDVSALEFIRKSSNFDGNVLQEKILLFEESLNNLGLALLQSQDIYQFYLLTLEYFYLRNKFLDNLQYPLFKEAQQIKPIEKD